MGQKAHPYGLRLGYIKPWKSRWFSKGLETSKYLHEDLKVRKYVKTKLAFAGVSNIEIERSSGRVRVRIFTARPGVIIGRRGQEIDKVKDDLAAITNGELFVDIKEVKSPQTDAQLIAENIAGQIEKRIGFRRAMKKAVQVAMQKGALGIKVICKGRLGGSDIARAEKYHEGKVPLSTFRADVDYGFTEAKTTYGAIGCKVWVYKGDILVKKELEEQNKRIASMMPAEPAAEAAETKAPKAKRKTKSKKKSVAKEAEPKEDSADKKASDSESDKA